MIATPDFWPCPACCGLGRVSAFACCGRASRKACCGEPHTVEFDCYCCSGAGRALGDMIRSWADSVGDGALRADQEARELDANTQNEADREIARRL